MFAFPFCSIVFPFVVRACGGVVGTPRGSRRVRRGHVTAEPYGFVNSLRGSVYHTVL